MKTFLLLTSLLISNLTFGAENKLPNNKTTLGQKTSALEKSIVFDNNLGASNTAITSTPSLNDLKLKSSKVKIGTGVVSSSPELQFNVGTVSAPTIKYNDATSKIEFSNDGINYKGIGSGSGGGGGGINLLENPDFEANVTTGWIASGLIAESANYTIPTTDNTKFVSLTAAVSGAYYESSSYQISDVLNGQDCELNFNYQNLTGSWRAEVFSSGTIVASQTLTNNTNWAAGPKIFYPCGQLASTETKVRYTNLVSGTLALDDVYLGAIRSLKNGAIVEAEYPCAFNQTGFTATNASQQCWRVGDKLKVRGHFRVAASNANAATIILPNNLQVETKNQPIRATHIFGKWVRGVDATTVNMASATNGPRLMFVENAVPDRVYFAIATNAQGGANPTANFVDAAGTTVAIANDQISFEFEVPIKGWAGSGTTFDSVCPNDTSCENVFSAKVALNGAVTAENLDFILGNCTNANPSVCTFNSGIFTVAPNCTGSQAVTSSTVTYANTAGFTVSCQKSPPDYKFKEDVEGYLSKTVNHAGFVPLKIVKAAFGQANDTTICTVSPCGIFRSSGEIAAIPRVNTGSIQLQFNAGTWTVPPSCFFTVRTTAANTNIYPSLVSTSVSTYEVRFTDANNSGTDSFGHFMCIGY